MIEINETMARVWHGNREYKDAYIKVDRDSVVDAIQVNNERKCIIFSGSFRKKIAKVMSAALLFVNVSPAFAMRVVQPDYQVIVRQKNVLNDVTGAETPALVVEAFRLTEQTVSGVETMEYQAICSQAIMTSPVARMFDAVKHNSFVDIESLGKICVDENNAVVLDPATLLDPTKTVSFTIDGSVILDSLRSDTIEIAAPNITVRGNSFIKFLNVCVDEGGVFAIENGSRLTTESAIIKGATHNYGTLEFLGDGSALRFNQSVLCNNGIIKGGKFALENAGAVINQGTICGRSVGLQSNFLQNDGTIGEEGSSVLDLLIHKSFVNRHNIFGKSAKIVLTSDEKGLLNSGAINIGDAELQISGAFENNGRAIFGKISGDISTFLNVGEFISQTGSLSINSGENRHILRLGSLTSAGDFFNYFTNDRSFMQVESLLGAGRFFNRSAFSMIRVGTLGVGEFYNQNNEFIAQYGVVSFGNAVRFLNGLDKIVNEGALFADTLHFEDTDAVVTNAQSAVIRTSREITGKVGSFDNLGDVFAENSLVQD